MYVSIYILVYVCVCLSVYISIGKVKIKSIFLVVYQAEKISLFFLQITILSALLEVAVSKDYKRLILDLDSLAKKKKWGEKKCR